MPCQMKRTNSLKNDNNRIFLQYTVLFCIFAAGIFCALIIFQRSFMQFRDAYTQGAFRLLELRNQAGSLARGDGFSFWSWYEGPGIDEPLDNFIEAGMIAGALFPQKYVELGLTAAALFRMYLGGIAFILMGKEVGLSRRQSLIGSLLYVFSACFIGMAIRQSEMLLNAYLFPLLVWSAERIYKKKSPLPFMLVVAYYTSVAIYNAYMSAIVIIIYILIRYRHYNDKFDAKEYAAVVGRFMLYGILGILLSAFTSLFSIETLRRASSDSSLDPFGLLFDGHQYAVFGKMLLGSAATYDYVDIGIPILIIMLLPVAAFRCTRKTTNIIMFIMLFVMMMFPFFNSMFNGFGYVSFRWSYMLLFFGVWSGAEQFDAEVLKDKKAIAATFAGLCAAVLWAVGPNLAGETNIGLSGKFFWLVQLLAGFALLIVFNHIRKTGHISKGTTAMVLIISCGALSLGWSAGFYGNRENFAEVGTVHKQLEKSTLRVSDQIGDEGFYRVDSVDGINRHAELRFPANENIWWKSNNLFIYNSRIPETLTAFNVELGNSYGYARRVYMLSNVKVLPKKLGAIHPKHFAPSNASLSVDIFSLILLVIVTIIGLDPLTVYAWFANAATLGLVLLQCLTSISVVAFFRKHECSKGKFHTVVAPILAAIGLAFVAGIVVVNFPDLTGSVASAIVMGILIPVSFAVGAFIAARMEKKDPAGYAHLSTLVSETQAVA